MTSPVAALPTPPENHPGAKFQLITATQIPHKCCSCGAGADGKKLFIDWGLSIEWEGAFYLCEDCAREIATVMGYLAPEGQEVTLTIFNELNKTIEELKNERDTVVSQLHAYRTLLGDSLAADSSPELEDTDDQDPSGQLTDTDETEHGPSEPSSKFGL